MAEEEVVLGAAEHLGGAGVALAGGAAEELAVDAAAAVRLGGDHVQAAEFGDAAAELDVGAAAGHVRRDGDLPRWPASATISASCAVCVGVEHAMRPARGGEPAADFLAMPARSACRPGPARPCRSARRRARRRRPTSGPSCRTCGSGAACGCTACWSGCARPAAGRSATSRRRASHAVPVMPPMIGYWRKKRWKLRRARFSLSAVTGTLSFTSIAWCRPCRHERSAMTRPVNSSMIWTFWSVGRSGTARRGCSSAARSAPA